MRLASAQRPSEARLPSDFPQICPHHLRNSSACATCGGGPTAAELSQLAGRLQLTARGALAALHFLRRPRPPLPRAQPPALQTGRATAPRPPCTQCVCVCVRARACTNETPPASALCTHCECVRASVHETPLSLPASISLAPQRKLGLRTGGQREHRDVGAAASGRAPDQTRRRCKEDARKQHHRPALRC